VLENSLHSGVPVLNKNMGSFALSELISGFQFKILDKLENMFYI
jgi:hypothetical protein